MHSNQIGFGVSRLLYGNEHPPLQGTGQGNGIVLTCFGLLSCKMFHCMEHASHGLQILAAISLILLRIVGFAFVDDADLNEGAPDVNKSPKYLVSPFQKALNRWSGLLCATGGSLVSSKSQWWLIGYYWDSKDLAYEETNLMDSELCVF